MNEFTNLLTSNFATAILSYVIAWLTYRQKSKIESAGFITKSYYDLYNAKKIECDELKKEIEILKQKS